MITKEMLISDILDMDANIVEVLKKHGLNCHGCPASTTESLEEAANGHSVDLDKIIYDISNYFEQK